MEEPIGNALALLKRQAVLESGLRQLGGIRVTEERELFAVREQLRRYPLCRCGKPRSPCL